MAERVAGPTIIGQAYVTIVGKSGLRVNCDVLDQGAKANSLKNFRVSGFANVEALGIAPSFHVEYGALTPAMFVITNQ